MTKSLFHEPWFSTAAFNGISRALHGTRDEALSLEGSFCSRLVIYLLEAQRSGELFNKGLYDFYAFCQLNLSRSHAQLFQDLWVLYMLREKKGGYFVEFGACDGKYLSNTFLLESDYGWDGILAEPNPLWLESLLANRRCQVSSKCVYATTGDTISFVCTTKMPELSRISDVIPRDVHEESGNRSEHTLMPVVTISLLDLLSESGAPHVIDYLSVDTEGSEYEVLRAMDFARYAFRLITVEHAGEGAKREAIKDILEQNGYRRWRPELSRWDDWYFHVELHGA